ncbi:MAG TPA: hypothetical protein PK367_01365 [Candidatus Paceibacterota bacterium]|nr:hypothetical protein [Candidatus Paceibacterota bacterium]
MSHERARTRLNSLEFARHSIDLALAIDLIIKKKSCHFFNKEMLVVTKILRSFLEDFLLNCDFEEVFVVCMTLDEIDQKTSQPDGVMIATTIDQWISGLENFGNLNDKQRLDLRKILLSLAKSANRMNLAMDVS